jgi:hypothetical protein
VEFGFFTRKKLRQTPTIEFYPWNAPPASKFGEPKSVKPGRDPRRRARYYQSLLDSGKFESRAALARFLGVSRARVPPPPSKTLFEIPIYIRVCLYHLLIVNP